MPQLLSPSEKLKLAIDRERQKSQFASTKDDPCLALWLAESVKRNNPEAFDLNSPADLAIWALVRG